MHQHNPGASISASSSSSTISNLKMATYNPNSNNQDQQFQQPAPLDFRPTYDRSGTSMTMVNNAQYQEDPRSGLRSGESSRRPSTEYDFPEKGKAVDFSSTANLANLENQQEHQHQQHKQLPPGHHDAGMIPDGIDIFDPNRPKLGLKQRMKHFTWAWYTFPMATGGLSLLFFAQPHQFPGLRQIGLVIYIINLPIFMVVCSSMLVRFFLHPGSMKRSLTHPREGFFFPTAFLALATVITSTQRYAIPASDTSLIWAVQVAFWVYVLMTLVLAIGQYSYVFAAHSFELHTMMPTWILPIFPIMLSGTIASVIAGTQPSHAAVPIIVAGLTCQGLGFMVALMMYAHMVGRLMQAGLPNREHRPGLFMCVGPPAFTALALVGMAQALPDVFDNDMDGQVGAAMLHTMAMTSAAFLWALSLWWFGIGTIAVLLSPPKYFHLGWWAMVFPNTGFILATISLGNAFKSETVLYVANGMSVIQLCLYCFVLYHMIKAVITQDIMYPGRDEDVEDH